MNKKSEIIRCKDVEKMFGVSSAKASQIIRKVLDAYGLDPSRQIVHGSAPRWAFEDYYDIFPKPNQQEG